MGITEHNYINHVGMFAEYNEAGLPLIIHSISSSIGHYTPTAQAGLCISTLRALKNRIQVEEGFPNKRYDVSFHVFRTNLDPSLAEEALIILQQQARFRIPYDEKRLSEKIEREDSGMSDQDLKKLGETNYRTEGLYRSIKYAARYPLPLTRTRMDGIGRGLTCSMTLILAFQIAELRHKGLITSIATLPDAWISDKYGPAYKELDLPVEYKAYLEKLRGNSLRIEAKTLFSYSFWASKECSPETFSHQTLPVDAQTIEAAGLFFHMNENATWINMGELDVPHREFTTELRLQKQCRRKQSFTTAMEALQRVTETRGSVALSSSPSTSPLPGRMEISASQKSPQPTAWFVSSGLLTPESQNTILQPLAELAKRVSAEASTVTALGMTG